MKWLGWERTRMQSDHLRPDAASESLERKRAMAKSMTPVAVSLAAVLHSNLFRQHRCSSDLARKRAGRRLLFVSAAV